MQAVKEEVFPRHEFSIGDGELMRPIPSGQTWESTPSFEQPWRCVGIGGWVGRWGGAQVSHAPSPSLRPGRLPCSSRCSPSAALEEDVALAKQHQWAKEELDPHRKEQHGGTSGAAAQPGAPAAANGAPS